MNRRTRLGAVSLVLLALAMAPFSRARAEKPTFAERELNFQSGTIELSGTLILPAMPGPHPAVVFLHGSGPSTRAGARPYAEEFARLGVASLIFDKRGCGSSKGSWITASLDDLSQDALAAVKYLKSQEEIDPERIGLWGVSQAGWIAPHAAAKSQDIAFMILISGGGVTPRESELFSWGKIFDEYGLSAAQKKQSFDLLNEYYQYLASGKNRSELAAHLDDLAARRDDPLAKLAKHLDQIFPSAENQPNWQWVASYDPASDIEHLKCPLLLMFGDQDREHPTEAAIKGWREGLKKAGNDELTLMLFPGAGHG
ncbi:MAG TPA: alpha/beta hydrolase, partial [Candidatus Krumholzibacteria bacterium]|nr:alpha/beta hydrolase [Candidatus Krumholzibacteria bacterium]